MKAKKVLKLKDIMIIEAVILLIIGCFLFVVETRVTEENQKQNLISRLESVEKTFSKSYEETLEITELYDKSMQAKADAVAHMLDVDPNYKLNQETYDLYGVDYIFKGSAPSEGERGYRFYTATSESGITVTVKKTSDELNFILDNIYTQNKVLQRVMNLDDLFFIVTTSSGNIVYYPEKQFIGQNISVLGISLSDLVEKSAKWLRINRKAYYTSSISNKELDITITCGITSSEMTTNSHIAAGILYVVICLVFTVVVTYTYFSRQEAKRTNSNDYSDTMIKRKMTVFSLIGLLVIGLVTYHIQTLFSLTMYSIAKDNEVLEITANLEESKNSVEKLTEHYNDSYLNKAQIVADILVKYPELQTREELRRLSKIFDFQYIMLFDVNGVETLSDSSIVNFVISDDPEDQSYAFNVMKYGIPYVIQEPQMDEVGQEYHQFIGVTMVNDDEELLGFLQIAVSPEKLKTVVAEAAFDKILDNCIAGTNDNIICVDIDTKRVTYSSIGDYVDDLATDIGFDESQLRNRFYGYVGIDGRNYYSYSVEIENNYMYIVEESNRLFSGRSLITFITQLMCLANLVTFTFYMRDKDVIALDEIEDNPYVEVTMADGDTKTTLNIIARMMKQTVSWNDKTAEEKTGIIVRTIMGFFAVAAIIAISLRNVLYTDNTILGFIVSGRWEKGFNVFAYTVILVTLFIYSLAMNVFNIVMNEAIKMVSPKSETMLRLIKSFVHYVATILVIYYCMSLLGFDTQSLLASAGLLTLVVGLGARDLVTDILAGIFIIFEREFQVGDIIELNGYKGRVIEIGIRTTRIINNAQDVKSINNRNLTNIVNKTRVNSYCDVIINVPFDQDINGIEKMLNENLPKVKELSPYIISGPTYGGIDDMSGRCIRLSIRTECYEAYKFEVRTVVNKAIKQMFDENGYKLM